MRSVFCAWNTMVGTGEQDRNVVFVCGVQNLVGDKDKQRGFSQTITMIRLDLWLIHLPCLVSQSQNPKKAKQYILDGVPRLPFAVLRHLPHPGLVTFVPVTIAVFLLVSTP